MVNDDVTRGLLSILAAEADAGAQGGLAGQGQQGPTHGEGIRQIHDAGVGQGGDP